MTGIVDDLPELTLGTSMRDSLHVVFRDEVVLAVTSQRTFTDLTASPGEAYRYACFAIDRQNPRRRSHPSESVALTMPGMRVPLDEVVKPEIPYVTALNQGEKLVHLVLVEVPGLLEVWRSVLLYRNGLPVSSAWLAPGEERCYVGDDGGLVYGQHYTYAAAVRAGGPIGPLSNLASVRNDAPPGFPAGERMISP